MYAGASTESTSFKFLLCQPSSNRLITLITSASVSGVCFFLQDANDSNSKNKIEPVENFISANINMKQERGCFTFLQNYYITVSLKVFFIAGVTICITA